MRKPILMAGIALLFLSEHGLKAQVNLNWLTSFLPSWNSGSTSGSAPNVGGFSVNCTAAATITGGGSFQPALGSSGALTPTVSGATFTVPGTSDRLQVTPNFTTNGGYTDILITFTTPATNVAFKIVDIDKNNSTSTTYYDQVTVTGSYGATNYNATLTKYDGVTDPNFLTISGNVAHVSTTSGQAGNTASDAGDQRGTVNVSFGSNILTSIKVHYNNAPGADADPASQAIAVGSVSFTSTTLPVTLFSFSGLRQSQDILLNWTTIQEFNSASFEIERSNGTDSWQKIGTVTASGNTTSEKKYNFTDINPQGLLLLYRLKLIDTDNKFKYSNIVRITAKNFMIGMLTYPNPFTSQVNININSASNQPVSVFVYDAAGKILRNGISKLYTGNNSIEVNGLDKLSAGIYYFEVKDNSGAVLGRSLLLKY